MPRRPTGLRAEIMRMEAELTVMRTRSGDTVQTQFKIPPMYKTSWGIGAAGPMARPDSSKAICIGYGEDRSRLREGNQVSCRRQTPVRQPDDSSAGRSSPAGKRNERLEHTIQGGRRSVATIQNLAAFEWFDAPKRDHTKSTHGARVRPESELREASLNRPSQTPRAPSAAVRSWDTLHPNNSKALPSRTPLSAAEDDESEVGSAEELGADDLTSYRLQFNQGALDVVPVQGSAHGKIRDKVTDMRNLCLASGQTVDGVIATVGKK